MIDKTDKKKEKTREEMWTSAPDENTMEFMSKLVQTGQLKVQKPKK